MSHTATIVTVSYDTCVYALQTPSEISKNALNSSCTICSQAVDLFLEVIGAEAGHMALRSLATGGVYIAGAFCVYIF